MRPCRSPRSRAITIVRSSGCQRPGRSSGSPAACTSRRSCSPTSRRPIPAASCSPAISTRWCSSNPGAMPRGVPVFWFRHAERIVVLPSFGSFTGGYAVVPAKARQRHCRDARRAGSDTVRQIFRDPDAMHVLITGGHRFHWPRTRRQPARRQPYGDRADSRDHVRRQPHSRRRESDPRSGQGGCRRRRGQPRRRQPRRACAGIRSRRWASAPRASTPPGGWSTG